MSLSVVLPVFNEEGNIETVINSVAAFLPSLTDDAQIIAVDDGSRDSTGVILDRLASRLAYLKIVRHQKNYGYGAALRSGFKAAGKEFILLMDADRQFEISEIRQLWPFAKEYDIVAGFREKRRDAFPRIVLGRVFNGLMNLFFGLRIKDIDCGFKLFKAGFIKKLRLSSTGIAIHTEIFLKARKAGARIKEVGVRHSPRIWGRQKTVKISVISRVLVEIINLGKKR